MATPLIGTMESRLLALERRLALLDGELTGLARDGTAIGQGIWEYWGSVGILISIAPPPPAPTGVSNFSDVCPLIPYVLSLRDTLTGTTSITWDSSTQSWHGCSMYSRPGSVTCTARMIPIWFELYGQDDSTNWDLYARWFAPNNGNVCPTSGKTCSNDIRGSGTLFRSTICAITCNDGVFATSGAFDWVNQNQIGLPGTTSTISIG